MMSLLDWVQQLSDDYLISWTNRGLFRRAKRQCEHVKSEHWQISNDKIMGTISDYSLTLSGARIADLDCSCGVLEPCSHKLTFLIALRGETSQAMTTVQFNLDHWLVSNIQSLSPAFSASLVKGAIKSWHQGANVSLTAKLDHGQVVCTLKNGKCFSVYLPATAGWEQALCSCKETHCIHLALAIIGLSVRADRLKMNTAQFAEKIAPSQLEQIVILDSWLDQIIAHGLNNLMPAQLSHGLGLVTELNQADLPNLASRLGRFLAVLSNVMRHCIDVNTNELIAELTYLSLTTHSLQQSVLPQPGYQLTGEHKRRYVAQRLSGLMPVMVEHWQASSGAMGYRNYVFDLELGDWYCFSDGRRVDTERQWSSKNAYHNQQCGQYYLNDLLLSQIDLETKVSSDHTLQCRVSTLVAAPQPVNWQLIWNNPLLAIDMQWQRFVQQSLQVGSNKVMDTLGWLKTLDSYQLRWQPHRHYGEATLMSECGQPIKIRDDNKRVLKEWTNQQPTLLFGRWYYDANERYFEVLKVFIESDFEERLLKSVGARLLC